MPAKSTPAAAPATAQPVAEEQSQQQQQMYVNLIFNLYNFHENKNLRDDVLQFYHYSHSI